MPTTSATKEIAKKLGVSVATVRNWSDQYAEYLSETARPGHLPERRFTDLDLTKLAYIRQLRREGMQSDQIKKRMGETTFNDTEVMPQQATIEPSTSAQQASLALQDSATFAPALIVAVDDLETRLALLEASTLATEQNRRDPLYYMAIGAIGALVFVVLLLLLAVLFGGVR